MATNEESLIPVSPKPKAPFDIKEVFGDLTDLKKMGLQRALESEQVLKIVEARLARLETNIKKHMEANGEVYKQ
jgi:hypothetical protein